MARGFVKAPSGLSKLWMLVGYFYGAPLLMSVFLIIQSGGLLGDFANVQVQGGYTKILFAASLYLAPLFLIGFFLKRFGKNAFHGIHSYKKFLFSIIVLDTILTAFFGALPIGGVAAPGVAGFFQSLVFKLNPHLCFLLFVALGGKGWKILVGCFCVGIIGLLQKSLLGYFILAMSLAIYVAKNHVNTLRGFFVLFLAPLIFVFTAQGIISRAYEIRNNARDSDTVFVQEAVLSYAFGRVNALSSLYQIMYEPCCEDIPGILYGPSTFFERLSGLALSDSKSPAQVYNDMLIGEGADYAIFTSMAGMMLILLKTSLAAFLVTIPFLLAVLWVLYLFIPLPPGNERLPLFLCIIYLPYLSGDIWEISMLFQSILLLHILYSFSSLLKRRCAPPCLITS